MAPEIPERIGRYDVISAAGGGSMGTVYKAFDDKVGRMVAIRTLARRIRESREQLEQFRRGIQGIAGIDHPNIVRVFETGEEDDTPYVVMEYVDGTSLAERMRAGRLTLAQAIHVVREAAKGLDAAHQRHIVHQNLSPRSILVSRDFAEVKLADFGVGCGESFGSAAGAATAVYANLSTLHYCAPEQIRDPAAADARADVYSLGVVCYEALTGKVPIGKFSLPSEINRQLPLSLDPVVLKCLAANPAQRYQSVAAFLADLDQIEEVKDYQLISELKRLSGGRLFATKPTRPSKKARDQRLLLYAAIAAVVVVVGAFAAVLVLRGRSAASPPVEPAATQADATPAPTPVPPASAAQAPAQEPVAADSTPGGATGTEAVTVPPPDAAGAPGAPATGPPVPLQPAGDKPAPAETTATAAPAGAAARPATPPNAGATGTPPTLPAPAGPRAASPGAAARATARLNEEAAAALAAIKAKVDSGQPDGVAADLTAFVSRYADTPSGPEASILLAKTQAQQGRLQDAIATYEDAARRYKGDQRAAEALFNQAQTLQKTPGGDAKARGPLAQIGNDYPQSTWFVPAMTVKMTIEDRLRLQEMDPVLGVKVPASLLTRRRLIERAPRHQTAEAAMWRVGETYEDMKRYDLAAQMYADLGTRFPDTRFDAWFKAGEIDERRLNRREDARAAYLKVPVTSPRYRDAQDRARRLGGR